MRSLRAVLAALLTAAAAITVAPSAQAADGKYVALGDSYAVAVGTRTYDEPGTDCRRGPLAYPRLWAEANPSVDFVEAACSGATTADVINSQVSSLTSDTTLVTLQVGGNDVGFVDVLKECILTVDDRDCVGAAQAAERQAQSELSASLTQTYAAVRAAAPSAKVVVVGYPRLYTIGGTCGIFGLSDTERAALNSAADTLAGVISARAGEAGFAFLDARPVFDAHTICSAGPRWVTSLEWDKLNESYHPNAAGHRDGYLPALNALTGA